MKQASRFTHSAFRSTWLLLALTGGAIAAPPAPADLPDRVEKILPGVVNISATTVVKQRVYGMDDFLQFWFYGAPSERQLPPTLGSGFLIDKAGFILTNNHVVENASDVLVTLHDKRQFHARVVGTDEKFDVALLQIADPKKGIPTELRPVDLGDSDSVRIAEPVLAIGNPFGLEQTVTMGIISARNRSVGAGPLDDYLQTDAAINPGNSGGPLFNLKGQVIGINTFIFSRTGQSGGLGFAIPINKAVALIPDLKKYGRVPRPWLGILGLRMTRQMRYYYDLPVERGVLIYNLVSRGPADRGGIAQGDIIVELNGKAVNDPQDLEKELARLKPDASVSLKIRRFEKTLTLKLRLSELPARIDHLPKGII